MQKTVLPLSVLLIAAFALGCGDKKQAAPPAALAVAKQFLGSITNRSAEDYCATFLPDTRYGSASGDQEACIKSATGWMSGKALDGRVIDSGEIKLARQYLGQIGGAGFRLSSGGHLVFSFPNGGQLFLEEYQADPPRGPMVWRVDVGNSGFTGP